MTWLEIGSVGFAYDAHNINVMSASLEIFCERTERALAVWQLKIHAAITKPICKSRPTSQRLAQASGGRNGYCGTQPEFNQRLIANELRRQCLTLITGQQFDAFGALNVKRGYAQPNLNRTAAQIPYVRF